MKEIRRHDLNEICARDDHIVELWDYLGGLLTGLLPRAAGLSEDAGVERLSGIPPRAAISKDNFGYGGEMGLGW